MKNKKPTEEEIIEIAKAPYNPSINYVEIFVNLKSLIENKSPEVLS